MKPALSQLPFFSNLHRFAPLLEENERLPLLVTGIAGVAGYNAFSFFRKKYGSSVFGQRPVNNWPLSGPGIVGVDLEDRESARQLIEANGIRSVLNCGGSCALKNCELDPAMAERANVNALQSLLSALEPTDARLIHLSVDLVFSGTAGGGQNESAATDPVTVYGKTMVQAEQLILQQRPQSVVLRISLPMGTSFNGHAGAIDWIQSRFIQGKPATLYYDEVRSPTYVECLNELFEETIAGHFSGLFHAGGTRHISLYEIAQIVNAVGGYDPDLLHGCYRLEAGPLPPRAGNVTLNSDKLAQRLGRVPFEPWPSDPQLVPNHRKWHYQRGNFPSAPEQIQLRLYQR
ncbi:MAG: sugar nucleotide-binding protein [Mariniblastus sp.]|nr:sugar nucleotide-binding protein [Mariniblastus sp.]